MNIVYLFLVYKNAELLLHTVRRLEAPGVSFYVHIDASSKEDFSVLRTVEHLYIHENRCVTKWGSIASAVAVVSCLQTIRAKFGRDGYVVLMSESDYPIKNNAYIRDYLLAGQRDYIISTPLPHNNPMNIPKGKWLEGGRRRYECYALRLNCKSIATIEPRKLNWGNFRQFAKVMHDNPRMLSNALRVFLRYPRRRHPSYMSPCGGELWFVLRLATVNKIVDFLQAHPDYTAYCEYTQNVDELFFPTLVHYLIPDSERRSTTLRYISWQPDGSSSPKDLSVDDEDLLKTCQSEHDTLFVRKVQDMEVCALIDKLVDEQ